MRQIGGQCKQKMFNKEDHRKGRHRYFVAIAFVLLGFLAKGSLGTAAQVERDTANPQVGTESTIRESTDLPAVWRGDFYTEVYRMPDDLEDHAFLRVQSVRVAEPTLFKFGVELNRDLMRGGAGVSSGNGNGNGNGVDSWNNPALVLESHYRFDPALRTLVGVRTLLRKEGDVEPQFKAGLYGGTYQDWQFKDSTQKWGWLFSEGYYEAMLLEGTTKSKTIASAHDRFASLVIRGGWRYPLGRSQSGWRLDPLLLEARGTLNFVKNTDQEYLNLGPRLQWLQTLNVYPAAEGQISASVFVARSWAFGARPSGADRSSAASGNATASTDSKASSNPYWFLFTMGGSF